MNTRISINKKITPFKIQVKYEHGDADLTTKECFTFSCEKDFLNAASFFYECMNFAPKTAYGNLGCFQPIPSRTNNGHRRGNQVWNDLKEIANTYDICEDDIYEYIPVDAHYNNGYAVLDGIKGSIDDNDIVFVFKQALETNKIVLPNIGDIINVNVNNITGLGSYVFGGEHSDYLPNSGVKDFYEKTFDAKVLDCAINFNHDYDNRYYHSYTHFSYLILFETTEDVLNDGRKTRKGVIQIDGYDPYFETKFDKLKYDDMNFYEI